MPVNKRSQNITFRLPREVCEALDVLAAAQGISRGHWARGQVLAALSRPSKDELEAVLNNLVETNIAIETKVNELQRALIRHLYYTLTKVGDIEPSSAESLVKEKLFPEGK